MSGAYPCTYILVGRSADPRDVIADLKEVEAMKTKEEIRSYLIKTGKFTSPSEIEKETVRIFKNNRSCVPSVIWSRWEVQWYINLRSL
jgi:hypothetical protein